MIIRQMENVGLKLERKKFGGSVSKLKSAYNLHRDRYDMSISSATYQVTSHDVSRIMSCNGNLALPTSRPQVRAPSNRRFCCFQNHWIASKPGYGRVLGYA